MKKGFTLIELLAVIIILAVVALIATPQVLDVISDAKVSTIKSSLSGYADAVKLKATTDYFNNGGTYSICFDLNELELNNNSVSCQEGYYTSNNNVLLGNCTVNGEGTFWYVNGTVTDSKPDDFDALKGDSVSSNSCHQTNTSTPDTCFTFNVGTGTITNYDFDNCTSDVVIPDTIEGFKVKNIGQGAFMDTDVLTCYDSDWNPIEEDKSYVHTEGDGYEGCWFETGIDSKFLTSVILPGNLENIGFQSFAYSQITSLILPNSLITIGESAFDSNFIENLEIGNNVTTIGDYAFGWNSISNLIIGNSVTTIGESAFDSNMISSLVIPNSVISLGVSSFSRNQIQNVTLSENLTELNNMAFFDNQITDIAILDKITSIREGSLARNKLTNITIPKNVQNIEPYAFTNNFEVISVTADSANSFYKSINNAIYSKDGTNLVIGTAGMANNIENTVTTISDGAFNAIGIPLTSTTIPTSVTSIGSMSYSQNQLTSITIPSSVDIIKFGAFMNNNITECNAIIDNVASNVTLEGLVFNNNGPSQDITIEPTYSGDTCSPGNNKPVITLNGNSSISILEGSTYSELGAIASDLEDGDITANIVISNTININIQGTYYVYYNVTDSNGGNATQLVRTVNVQSKSDACFTFDSSTGTIMGYDQSLCGSSVEIPSEIRGVPVTTIANQAFYNKNITSLIIADSVTTIGEWAFCQNQITSLIIPDNVTFIGPVAFLNNQLSSLSIGSGITKIEDSSFGNNQITNLVIPDNIEEIYSGAFSGNQISNLIIGNGLKTIGDSAFHSNRLTSLIIPNNVTFTGFAAFYNNLLTSVTLGTGLTSVGDHVFGYNNIANITIPNNIITIEQYAFDHNKLTNITIPNSVTTIGQGAFECNELTSATIPSSVTSIAAVAFYDNNLTSITIPGSVTTIGGCAFQENQLTTVSLSNGLLTIGSQAFYKNLISSIIIPNTVTTIDTHVFNTNKLTSITIPNSVTSIGYGAFANNLILQGNAIIDNSYSGITLGGDVFMKNGSNGLTTITPTYLR